MTFPELLSLLQLLLSCFAQSTNSFLELKILSVVNKCPISIYSSGSKNSSNEHFRLDGQKFWATFAHLDESFVQRTFIQMGESGLEFLPIWAKVLLKLKKKNDFLTSKPTFLQ
ncbi:hypothetical protein M9H77_29743 [Catharanthus roseus]|uniref:Uncharacterized protein n=1 Tax=Catharanthus roseus TaxID=4058 RepID=A0ACB9ZVN1_CATRO|nr:hypothetical protein M9H77_29743 [Catharanthus roseus]